MFSEYIHCCSDMKQDIFLCLSTGSFVLFFSSVQTFPIGFCPGSSRGSGRTAFLFLVFAFLLLLGCATLSPCSGCRDLISTSSLCQGLVWDLGRSNGTCWLTLLPISLVWRVLSWWLGESLVRGTLVSQKVWVTSPSPLWLVQLSLFGRSLSNCLTFVYVLNVVFGTCDRTDGFVLVFVRRICVKGLCLSVWYVM